MGRMVIGIDEVGNGAWAGPVVVCAVVVENTWLVPDLKDSKDLSREKITELRNKLVDELKVEHVIVERDSNSIDSQGLKKALWSAWLEAGNGLQAKYPKAQVFLDGNRKPIETPDWVAIVDADSHVPCVMAAAIIAKHHRDSLMIEYSKQYPQYGFSSHVGYGSPFHREALAKYGVCPLHRRYYKPIKEFLKEGPHPEKPGLEEVSQDLYSRWNEERKLQK